MSKKNDNGSNRSRQMLAQEAARIIVNQGIRDYRSAKIKAAERLGMSARGALPGNAEIEQAVGEHLQLFGSDSHADFLAQMRGAALSAMCLLSEFTPRLVGPVLNGTADESSPVTLHVFADSSEQVAMRLSELGVSYRLCERRFRSRRDQTDIFAGFTFHHADTPVEAAVFPLVNIRQAPISPINGNPMRRANTKVGRGLLD